MAVGRKTGGRVAGTPNKAGRDLRAAAQKYTKEALAVLVKAMRSDESPRCEAAALALLDRGHGKPAQAVTGENGEGAVKVEITVGTGVSRPTDIG